MNKTKLIPPFVMLMATAFVAVITYLRDFSFGTWLVIVLGVMVLFLFIGEVIKQMIEYFYKLNEKKQKEEEELLKITEAETEGDEEAGRNGET